MNITFNQLQLRNFKNHRDLTAKFGAITQITGQNGEGKSSIGEAITWALYGTDLLGSELKKKELSPEPINYTFDRVEVHLLMTVDDKQVLLSRMIENGDMKYYINETPKKATEFKDLVASLFDKHLFLSLFNPAYFFSQKWQEQRDLFMRNVLLPPDSKVLAKLPKPQADKLSVLLKKDKLDDLDAQHKENKNRQDKALIAVKERVKTLQEQLDMVPHLSAAEVIELNEQLVRIDAMIGKHEEAQQKAAQIAMYGTHRQNISDQVTTIRNKIDRKKDNPPADKCDKCGQELDDETREGATAMHNSEIRELTVEHNALVAQHKTLGAELEKLKPADFNSDEFRLLQQTRQELVDMLKSVGDQERLESAVNEAKAKEKEINESFKDSVFILDAVKAFRAKEAEIMADELEWSECLTLQLYQENKGDGERTPYFEIYMNDKPYRKLSAGEKMFAGLELISVLSKQNNDAKVPCFLDNAESYTGAIRVLGQAIICKAVPEQEFTITEG